MEWHRLNQSTRLLPACCQLHASMRLCKHKPCGPCLIWSTSKVTTHKLKKFHIIIIAFIINNKADKVSLLYAHLEDVSVGFEQDAATGKVEFTIIPD